MVARRRLDGATDGEIKIAVFVRDELTRVFCSKRKDLPTALEIDRFRRVDEQDIATADDLTKSIIRCNAEFIEEVEHASSAGCEATTVADALRWAVRKFESRRGASVEPR